MDTREHRPPLLPQKVTDSEPSACLHPKHEGRGEERYVPNVNIAVLHIALGEKDNALISLERAAAEKDSWMTFLKVEPIWFELRGKPRFEARLRTMKLD